MAFVSSNIYRYAASIIYSMQTAIVIFIFILELKTLYRAVFHQQIVQISKVISPHSPKSRSVSPRSSPVPPVPASPTPQTLTPQIPTFKLSVSKSIGHQRSISKSRSSSPSAMKTEESISKLIFLLPMLSYLFYIITGICGALTVLGVHPCSLYAYIGPSCYIIAKMFMYSVFVYRLYIVYSDSAFAYNYKILLILSIIIIVNAFFNLIWNVLTLKIHVAYHDNNTKTCFVDASKAVLLTTIFFDFVISTLCCYLFIRPLLILNRALEEKKEKLRELVLKYMILTFVAVTTTFLSVGLMVISKMMGLIAIDIILNCICIALFNKFHDRYFKIICCATISICNKLCASKQIKINKEKSKKNQSLSLIENMGSKRVIVK